MHIDGFDKLQYYTFEDVFGREAFFYRNATLRIIGWETPISIIYRDKETIRICFKNELWDFASDYVDPPYKATEHSIFDDVFEELYRKEKNIRKLEYALKKYKEAGYEFKATKMFPDELMGKLDSKAYFGVENADVFKGILVRTYDCNELWYPVDVDAIIITDILNTYGGKADIAFPYNNTKNNLNGYIGYDGIFYALQPSLRDEDHYLKAFSIKNGIKAIESDLKIKHNNFFSDITFLKKYVVAEDGTCYNYDGNICEKETLHFRNVNLINELIYTLSDFSKKIDYSQPHLEIIAEDMIYEVDIELVENLIIPALKSINALNKKAYNDFLEIKKLIVYAGLSRDFSAALQNIKEMNKAKVYGGSSRGFASKRLIENLNILKKRTSKKDFALLFNDSVALRQRIEKINARKASN